MIREPIRLSRDELALLTYFRQLSVDQQLKLLDGVEERCNQLARMEELASRGLERGGYLELGGRA